MLQEEGPISARYKNLARTLGLHDVILAVLKQESTLTEINVEYITMFSACYCVLSTFAKKNRENQLLLSHADYLDIMTGKSLYMPP
jgi:hypothetical protein